MLTIRYMTNAVERGLPPESERWLLALGERLRRARKALGVSAVAAAQAAGVSRVTWHRMESGAPGVAAGSYARALDALGLVVDLNKDPEPVARPRRTIPVRIIVGDYPQLQALAWSLETDTSLTPREALSLYERNSRHLDTSTLSDTERTLLEDLREALVDDVHP